MRVKHLLWLGALGLALQAASATAAEDFYKGKTLKIIAGTAAGSGGYDAQVRTLAPYLSKHIAGNPNVIIQNMPAAGGMVAINHVYNVALKDGTEIGLFNRGTLFAPILGDDQAKYKSEQFHWLGTPASYAENAFTFFVRSALPYKSMDELRTANPPINVGNVSGVIIRALPESMGVKMKLITGYTGPELDLALQRGELDALGSSLSNLHNQTTWLKDGFIRVLAQFGRTTRHPDLPNVPLGRELVKDPEDLALLEVSEMPLTIGYPFAAPPGIPANLIPILRAGFRDAFNDPQYQADVARAKLEFSPKLGEQLQADINKMVSVSPSVAERYRKLAAAERGGR
jgi:tripartite-type tricarboxylate transporter receptor subunit TctC